VREVIMAKPSASERLLSFLSVLVFVASIGTAGRQAAKPGAVASGGTLRFTILYDNFSHREGTAADWGFSCLIEGTEKTILFDTGTDPRILMRNVDALGVDLKKVEQVVLSHEHDDHVGGVFEVLKRNPDITVFYPVSFRGPLLLRLERLKPKAQAVDTPLEICRGIYLTGEMGDRIKEQSLVIDAPGGLVIVTGCSHQGIVSVLRRAKEIADKPIQLVFGGLHLSDKSEAEIAEIIATFRELKVERCGATHCTGDGPIAAFKKAFGARYLPMGTGRVVEIPGF
jgi:7,8-dihydropterin-6-yl-methyl-4-(beta-D-ribofuranosyl)aminobenzene 5'-phosphate synthase